MAYNSRVQQRQTQPWAFRLPLDPLASLQLSIEASVNALDATSN